MADPNRELVLRISNKKCRIWFGTDKDVSFSFKDCGACFGMLDYSKDSGVKIVRKATKNSGRIGKPYFEFKSNGMGINELDWGKFFSDVETYSSITSDDEEDEEHEGEREDQDEDEDSDSDRFGLTCLCGDWGDSISEEYFNLLRSNLKIEKGRSLMCVFEMKRGKITGIHTVKRKDDLRICLDIRNIDSYFAPSYETNSIVRFITTINDRVKKGLKVYDKIPFVIPGHGKCTVVFDISVSGYKKQGTYLFCDIFLNKLGSTEKDKLGMASRRTNEASNGHKNLLPFYAKRILDPGSYEISFNVDYSINEADFVGVKLVGYNGDI